MEGLRGEENKWVELWRMNKKVIEEEEDCKMELPGNKAFDLVCSRKKEQKVAVVGNYWMEDYRKIEAEKKD